MTYCKDCKHCIKVIPFDFSLWICKAYKREKKTYNIVPRRTEYPFCDYVRDSYLSQPLEPYEDCSKFEPSLIFKIKQKIKDHIHTDNL